MTDNEKRAHDLAIATLSFSLQPEMLKGMANASGTNKLNIDPYHAYIGLYHEFLRAFGKDFPTGDYPHK